MNIILDPTLQKNTNVSRMPSATRLAENTIPGKFEKPADGSTFKFLHKSQDEADVDNFQLGFVGMLSRAYNNHEKLEIAPHDIWFIVLTEIASIIKQNVERCRPLFTKSDEKVDILVPTSDPTQINLADVVAQLKKAIPINTEIFIPELSTLDDNSRIAMYAALCDGVSPYYSYSTYCCGIPEIRVTGTSRDWCTLLSSCSQIAASFLAIGLPTAVQYMIRVGDIIDKIWHSTIEPDIDFWKGIFTSKNVGSGGELVIDGWITDLFFVRHNLKKLENFIANLAVVDYTHTESGRKFRGVYGAFNQLRTSDDFVKAGYGSFIYEQIEKSRIILVN